MKEAIEKLLEHYQNYGDRDYPLDYNLVHSELCPLCEYSKKEWSKRAKPEEKDACMFCPWVLLERKHCFDPPHFRWQLTEERIERLERWLLRLDRITKTISEQRNRK